MRLYAGCVEIYKSSLYINEEYYKFLDEIGPYPATALASARWE